jgi:hypothetical protein
MRWGALIVICLLAASTTAAAEPPTEPVARAAAARWATAAHVCAAMARARPMNDVERRDCRRIPWAGRLSWASSVDGDHRLEQATIGDESFYVITLTVARGGRIVDVKSFYSQGGI